MLNIIKHTNTQIMDYQKKEKKKKILNVQANNYWEHEKFNKKYEWMHPINLTQREPH